MNFDALYANVLPYCPGCPDVVALESIRNAAIELCERTRMFRITSSMATVAGNPRYLVSVATALDYNHYALVSVSIDRGALADTRFDLWVGSSKYPVVAPDRAVEMMRDDPQVQIAFMQTDTLAFLSPIGNRSTVFVNPAPTVAGLSIRMVFAVKPHSRATSIQDQVGHQSYPTIAAGAVARLKAMEGEPWYDPAGSATYGDDFDTKVRRLANHFARGYSNAPLRVQPR